VLSAEEEAAIVAFMRTLDDGWVPPANRGIAASGAAD